MIEKHSFFNFVFHDQWRKNYMWLTLSVTIGEWVVFKYFYPMAGFFNNDSYYYIRGASEHLAINLYPIGYSLFLEFVHFFSTSDLVLTSLQYLSVHFALLVFLYSLFYLFRPGRAVSMFLLLILSVDPIYLYLANYVSSDCFFLSLSLIWVAFLLWLVKKPTMHLIVWFSLVTLCAFVTRYSALWYPIVGVIAFLSLKGKLGMKMIAVAILNVPLLGFILFTSYKYQQLSDKWQFSPFSGWQLANNSMYAYRYVAKGERKEVPSIYRDLDEEIREYFDSTRDIRKYPGEAVEASTIYMWDLNSPLKIYERKYCEKVDVIGRQKRWATMGPIYNDFGKWVISNYPGIYAKHFIWPNLKKFFSPPVEFLAQYNTGRDTAGKIGETWFGYKSKKLFYRVGDLEVHILDLHPISCAIFDVLFIISMIGLLGMKSDIVKDIPTSMVSIFGLIWMLNLFFSVFSASISLRLQTFPMIVFMCVGIMLMEKIFLSDSDLV